MACLFKRIKIRETAHVIDMVSGPARIFPLVDQLFGALLQFGNWSLAGIDAPLAYGYEGYL